jgi:Tripartite tricarboxylate transporter TctB family
VRSSPRGNLITAAAMFLIGAAVLISLRDTPDVPVEDPLGPYGLPRALAIGIIAVAALIAAQAWWSALRPFRETATIDGPLPATEAAPSRPGTSATKGTSIEAGPPEEPEPEAPPRASLHGGLTIAATVGYALLLPVLGFVAASLAFGIALLPILGTRRLRTIVAVPAFAVAGLWLVFAYALDVGLPTFLNR